MRIALATPPVTTSVNDCLDQIHHALTESTSQGAEIVCFPEAYLPGLRGLDFEVPAFDPTHQERALQIVSQWATASKIAVNLGTERHCNDGRQIAAAVFDSSGTILGWQTKIQLDPTEEPYYVPGTGRQLFEVNGVKFGVAICHEAFRYPETVRWAAVRGAKIVFHPHCTGSDKRGTVPTQWGSPASPYYEKAMMCRALENTIYFAGVNYAVRYQESATCIISPSGECLAQLPYGEAGVLVQDIDLDAATGLLARRFAPERYHEIDKR